MTKTELSAKLAIKYIMESTAVQKLCEDLYERNDIPPDITKKSLIEYYQGPEFVKWWNSCSKETKRRHIKKWSNK